MFANIAVLFLAMSQPCRQTVSSAYKRLEWVLAETKDELRHTNLDGYTEWFRNTCRGEREADLVPLGHYIYGMCLVEMPVNISPTRRLETEG